MLIAKWGVMALVISPIIASDTAWQFYTPANDLGIFLFENWWKLAEFAGIGGAGWAKFNSIEILIAGTGAAVIWSNIRRRTVPVITFELVAAMLFLATVVVMFAWGIASGGAMEPALWQVRPYLQLVAVALLVPQVVRTPAYLQELLRWMLSAIVLKALLACAIFVFLARGRFSGWRELVGHEDSVFFVATLCFLFAYLAYERGVARRLWPWAAGAVVFAALVLNLRRAGYVALAMNTALLPILMAGRRRVAAALVVGCGVVSAILLVIFINSRGAPALLAQKVLSVFGGGEATDVSSNVYRAGENLNLWHTVRENPLGLGFGKPFDKIYEMADISSTLANWDYQPHNMIFGLWMELGTVGLTIFLFFYAVVLMSASFAIRQTDDALGKSAVVFCATALTSGLLVTNLDQFVATQRGALFLGAVIGLVAAMAAMQGRSMNIANVASRFRPLIPTSAHRDG